MDPGVYGNLTFRQLAHFVAVAETGTISGASERLFMSQSAVSASLTELERVLGTDLCVRRRAQGVSLTSMGRQVLAKARQLLADASELSYLTRGNGLQLVGPLVVGCFVTLGPTVLPRLLEEFESLHPLVTIDFVEGSQTYLQQKLRAGELDIAVLYDLDLEGSYNTIVLYEPRAYALFCEGHPFAAQPTVTLEQLAPEPLALFDSNPSTSYAMSLFHGRGLEPNVRHRTQTYELTRSIVARGLAYAILVQRPPNKLSYEGLPVIEREVEPILPSCPVVLAWPSDVRLSPRARELANIVGRQYSQTLTVA